VLFGGATGGGANYYGDTWEWDGISWTQRASSGPSPRYRHAMAYDAARGVTVLLAGRNAGSDYGDSRPWPGRSSPQRPTSAPLPRWGHAVAYDAARGVTVLFGGYDGDYLSDTWELGPVCGTCAGDINADSNVDGVDVAGWLRCTIGAAQPGDACACIGGMTA